MIVSAGGFADAKHSEIARPAPSAAFYAVVGVTYHLSADLILLFL
jgi:hypothetical protein